MASTHDTPEERDAKAVELARITDEKAAEVERVAKIAAECLEKELWKFRWETRAGYAIAIAIALFAATQA